MTRSVPPRKLGGGDDVPKDMGGGVVVEPGSVGDAGDDVVGAFDAEALAALVEGHGWAVGAGPVEALVEPAGGSRAHSIRGMLRRIW